MQSNQSVRERDRQIVDAVECRGCSAAAGDPCRNYIGKEIRPHPRRRTAYRALGLSSKRDQVLARLRELASDTDHERAHALADAALLAYIDDAEVSDAYGKIVTWCA